MTKTEYRKARRLVRDNGRCAYRWLGANGEVLRDLANQKDWLAERADIVRYCSREGIHCSVRHTGRLLKSSEAA